ncbi:Oxidoreductase, FAD-binding protein [Pseudomonas syringae pv. antirrhini]|uniref:Oxidoreductase, FAD-binding protein n=2 Tax=Pseudomonas syringae group TaxID=136849 RepID=A0A0P9LF16_9PSED|nr:MULTISPECIES: FAD-binding oxidoreductase [Pseudomonas]KPW52353.1 Oxidoreductase, FAD-binding protein [Pseudomonas syringae pv. antirrhini]RMO89689.1 Oxidoreductase, FAD-binding protein [Pseudomonas syringae pv. tagetis]RMP34928.1 Oxidoreductase, FAD-binding protein [Pseudomonas syringae pv. antirrhini]RMP44844.1 Oxidoreductase, FAD-binding protein [Pseudomonas syringae pv. antirrhini]RMW28938.1 Oxidoreductase, FAD-binding protein [Pseudomonas syringae pv. antirrhini]
MFIDYEIAVVGAGITGASIAAKLCSAGVSVVLIDKGAAGSLGASGYSGGLVRLYDTDPLLMELAAYSIGLINDGIFAGTYARALTRTGVIYRAAADQLGTVCRAIEQYGNARYPMRLLAGHELDGERYRQCAAAERINLFEAHACVGNVRQAVAALCQVVRRQGLLLEHREIKAIECRAPDLVHIEMGDATLRCRAVVVAAGGWSQHLLPLPLRHSLLQAGLEARSIPLARVVTESDWSLPVIDAVTQSYAIPLTRTIVQTGCGLRDSGLWPEKLARPDARHAEDACTRINQLCGFAGNARVLDVLPGFDSYSADGRPLLGFCAEQSPVYLAAGMSGLGFKFAPGIAQIAVEQLRAHLAQTDRSCPGWSAFSPCRSMPNVVLAGGQP